MPPPILLPRESSSSFTGIFAPARGTEIFLGGLVHIIDVAADVFGNLESSAAVGAGPRVGVGFEVAARLVLVIGLVMIGKED
jgi:hypothetical protein